jgi:hypothetical protein
MQHVLHVLHYCDTDIANAKHALLVQHHTAGATDIGTYVQMDTPLTYACLFGPCTTLLAADLLRAGV